MRSWPRLRPASLLFRTSLTLGVSALAIAVISIWALSQFVIAPIAEQSAEDEAALLVLSAQTWVELPPPARPYYELELFESHELVNDIFMSEQRQILCHLASISPTKTALARKHRLC